MATDKEKLLQLLTEFGVKYKEVNLRNFDFVYLNGDKSIEIKIDDELTTWVFPNFVFDKDGKFVEFCEFE